MRTLAFACAKVADGTNPIDGTRLDTSGLTFLGVVAIADPVRTDVPDAVSDVIRAGIQIKIVTGDTPATAKEIGRQIGLWQSSDNESNIITGPEFEQLSDEELRRRVKSLKIIARARPLDKNVSSRLFRPIMKWWQ